MNRAKHALVILVKDFDAWKEANMPGYANKEALEFYPGLAESTINHELKKLLNLPWHKKLAHSLTYGWW